MNKIMLEKWAAVPGKPRKMEYVGQPTGKAVFEELRHRLDGMGYLPDEYFDLDENWENGRKISPSSRLSSPARPWARTATTWTECSSDRKSVV